MTLDAPVVNPTTGVPFAHVHQADEAEVDRAIERAGAQPDWAGTAPADRARPLRRFAGAIDGAIEEPAQLELTSSGHTVTNARWEAGNVRYVLEYYAGAPERQFGRQIPVPGGTSRFPHYAFGSFAGGTFGWFSYIQAATVAPA